MFSLSSPLQGQEPVILSHVCLYIFILKRIKSICVMILKPPALGGTGSMQARRRRCVEAECGTMQGNQFCRTITTRCLKYFLALFYVYLVLEVVEKC